MNLASAVPELRPDWLVLRPVEVTWLKTWLPESDFLDRHYTLAAVFDVTGNLEKYACLPGRAYVMKDTSYSVYKKTVP